MINVAIVEDTLKDAETLKDYTRRAVEMVNETCEITVFNNAVDFLDGYRGNFDIVFMDIELPDINGMDAAKKLRLLDESVVLIFVTNMAQFAVGGYAVDAMDFMVKPVSYENVCIKISRAIKKIEGKREEKLVLPGKSGVTVIMIPQIRYVEIMNHRLTFFTTPGDEAAMGSLSKIEEKILRFNIWRCNNYSLVNLNFVTKVEDYTVWLGKEMLTVSRARKRPFLKDLADLLGGGV